MCSCLWDSLTCMIRSLLWQTSSFLQSPNHVVLVGLESSGKTTVLFRLKFEQYVDAVPTVGFNMEKVRKNGKSWVIWDVGGADRVRPLWRSYTRATDAIIFVVDSSSGEERLEEARTELHRLTKQQGIPTSHMKKSYKPPILVLANKQDLPDAKDVPIISKAMGLQDFNDSQPWRIHSLCAVTGEGLEEAMTSLAEMIVKSKKTASSS